MTKRLSETDWLKHGLKTLARSGYSSLKADPLAKALGVSRGSFYWHFKDLTAFHNRLLDYWQAITTELIIQEMEHAHPEEQRLEELMQLAIFGNSQARADQAIRQWAQYDKAVDARLKTVDAMRLDYLAQLLMASGQKKQDAFLRARFVYAATLGDSQIANQAAPSFKRADIRKLVSLMLH